MFSVFASCRQKIPRLPHVIPLPKVRHASTDSEILELGRSKWRRGRPNSFLIYFSQEMAALNEALPRGKRFNVCSMEQRKQIHERWLALSPEERVALIEARLQERGAPERSYAEDMATLDDVAKGMTEYLDQLQDVKNLSLAEFRSLNWLRKDHRDRILVPHSWIMRRREIAQEIQSLIKTQFTEMVDHKRVRMAYARFDQKITRKYGVTIENWPPTRFACPDLASRFTEMVGLYLMWKSGATRFRRLSPQEKKEWDVTRLKLYEKHKKPRPSGRSPSPVLVPSRERPASRLLIDPKVIGTIDQIMAFMDPVLVPKGRRRGAYLINKTVTQENSSS